MKQNIGPSQKAAVTEWIRRTRPGRSYSIREVFINQEADSMHIRAMQRLVALGLLKPGIPGGNPLREAF